MDFVRVCVCVCATEMESKMYIYGGWRGRGAEWRVGEMPSAPWRWVCTGAVWMCMCVCVCSNAHICHTHGLWRWRQNGHPGAVGQEAESHCAAGVSWSASVHRIISAHPDSSSDSSLPSSQRLDYFTFWGCIVSSNMDNLPATPRKSTSVHTVWVADGHKWQWGKSGRVGSPKLQNYVTSLPPAGSNREYNLLLSSFEISFLRFLLPQEDSSNPFTNSYVLYFIRI